MEDQHFQTLLTAARVTVPDRHGSAVLRGRSRDLEQLRELVRRRFTDGDLQMAMDPTATTELLARKLAGEAIEDNAEVVEKGIRAWSAHLKKESRLKPTIRKSGVLVHCDRPFLAARPHYFVDFAAAAAPRALLLIRPCAGALPKELALIDEQRALFLLAVSAAQAAAKDVAKTAIVAYYQHAKGKLACFNVEWGEREKGRWRIHIEPKVVAVYRRYLDRLIAELKLTDIPPTPASASASPAPPRSAPPRSAPPRSAPRRLAGAATAAKRLEYDLTADRVVRVGARVWHSRTSKRGVVDAMAGDDRCYVLWDGEPSPKRRKTTLVANLVAEVLGADAAPAAPDRPGQEVLVTGASNKTAHLLGRTAHVVRRGVVRTTVRVETAPGVVEEVRLKTANLHAVEEPHVPAVEAPEDGREIVLDQLPEAHAAWQDEHGERVISSLVDVDEFIVEVKRRWAADEGGGGGARASKRARGGAR